MTKFKTKINLMKQRNQNKAQETILRYKYIKGDIQEDEFNTEFSKLMKKSVKINDKLRELQ